MSDKLTREQIEETRKMVHEWVEAGLWDASRLLEFDPIFDAALAHLEAHLAACKPAPEAGECLECGQKPGTWEGCGTCDTGRGLEAHDLHACIPAPPAVCEACKCAEYHEVDTGVECYGWRHHEGGKIFIRDHKPPHTCKPSGA